MEQALLQQRFPKRLVLDGVEVEFRLMVRSDEELLLEFFQRVPLEDRRLLKDDVLDSGTIRGWCENLDYNRVIPLLAIQEGRIIGNATIHRERGWRSHVARIRVLRDPEVRKLKVGRALVRELIDLASSLNIAIVDAEVMAEQKRAIRLFESLDFVAIATLPQHALDLVGKVHDIVIFSYEVFPPSEIAVDRDTRIEDIDLGGSG